MPHHIQNLWLGGSPCFFKSCGSLKFWPTCSCTMTRPCHMRGQTVERLNFCVVPLPPKIYQFWIILVYFCTCSICVHANKGVPVIATAGHVGQLFEPISYGYGCISMPDLKLASVQVPSHMSTGWFPCMHEPKTKQVHHAALLSSIYFSNQHFHSKVWMRDLNIHFVMKILWGGFAVTCFNFFWCTLVETTCSTGRLPCSW